MALPMLVGGADCGPINPLQGLSKQFDRDRGLQQDQFGAGRAGSSKEVFRTQYAAAPGVDQDAARFFANNQPEGVAAGPTPFDLSLLRDNLPVTRSHVHTPIQSPPLVSPGAAAPWAADFMKQMPAAPSAQSARSPLSDAYISQAQGHAQQQIRQDIVSPTMSGMQQGPAPWSPAYMNRMNVVPFQQQQPYGALNVTSQPLAQGTQLDASRWDEAFLSHEAATSVAETVANNTVNEEQAPARRVEDSDELSRAAGALIEAVRTEENPKFANSAFLGLMKQLRDKEVVIEGDQMVPNDGLLTSGGASGWANDFSAAMDVKGKGKAVDRSSPIYMGDQASSAAPLRSGSPQNVSNLDSSAILAEEEIDAYFRQENDEYIGYWNGQQQGGQRSGTSMNPQEMEWDRLQRDWDRFEASATGIRPMSNYQFQPNNPYLLGTASTRHHAMHSQQLAGSIYESVLEMEAAVQRDPSNAHAWFQLGVRQQENERETKAIHALRRALELDPEHLPSWVALAISHTNEGNRNGSYEAIRSWVSHNMKYQDVIGAFHAQYPEREDMTQNERFNNLVDLLITMSRSLGEEIDADIQIALAVLMNTNEAYDKAKDCFLTALAMRPDDWQLYNRVGATLANSGQPSEALQYYYRALELNPSYIRARFNLGISCVNLRRYQEASQHILDALALQETDSVRDPDGSEDKRGVTSSALWDSLKTCCLHLRRLDLATICDRRDLEAFQLNYSLA